MARLNALLGLAVLLPAVTQSFAVVVVSGLLFGGVFLSIVASSTALVRHNLPQAAWSAGICTTAITTTGVSEPTVSCWLHDMPRPSGFSPRPWSSLTDSPAATGR